MLIEYDFFKILKYNSPKTNNKTVYNVVFVVMIIALLAITVMIGDLF